MSTQRNVIDFGRSRRAIDIQRSVTLPQLVISAQRSAKHQLRELLPAFFANIDNSLYDMADRAENSEEQNIYFEAMREIRIQKEAMQQAYFEALSDSFRNSLTQASKKSDTGSTLGLMDDEQLEESLAISNMVSEAEAQYREALYGLTQRFDFLIEDIEITNDNNPLRPEILFDAFTAAVEVMDVDIKVRLVAYKMFDLLVAQQIGPIYDSINADLMASGVLPRLKSTAVKSEEDSANPYENSAGGISVDEISTEEAAAMQALMAMDSSEAGSASTPAPTKASGRTGWRLSARRFPRSSPVPGSCACLKICTRSSAPLRPGRWPRGRRPRWPGCAAWVSALGSFRTGIAGFQGCSMSWG